MSPRLSTVNINIEPYWNGIYGNNKFPTNAHNNVARYRTAATLQVGQTALDIGCGQGGLGRSLWEKHGRSIDYVGVDFSKEAIDNTVHAKGTYICMDWNKVQEQADTVYVLELIEHVEDPKALLDKTALLAKKRIVIGTPRYGLIPPRLHRGEHQWDFTTEELTDLLAPYGSVGSFIRAGEQCHVVAVDL